MHKHNAVTSCRVVAVWMRVGLGRGAMGCPPRVGDADGSIKVAVAVDLLLEHSHAADRSGDMQAAIEHGDASRVVAAVLKPLQSLEQHRPGLLRADIGNNSAHGGHCTRAVGR